MKWLVALALAACTREQPPTPAPALEVPPGPYVVSFEDCGGHPGNGDPPPVQRTIVAAGARATVDFHGEYDYK